MALVVAIERSSTGHTMSSSSVWRCRPCGEGELRKFSHDSWPSEDEWDMNWALRVSGEDLDRLAGALRTCPDATAPACECAAHDLLRKTRYAVYGARIDEPGAVDPEALPVVRVALAEDGLPELVP